MFFTRNFTAPTLVFILSSTTAFADAGSTQVLEEYFAHIENSPLILNVSNKDSGLRSTKWTGISVASEDGKFIANMPWIEVKAGLLSGHTMTFAPQTDISFSDPAIPDNTVEIEIVNNDLTIEVSGDEGDRTFNTAFKQMQFYTKPGGFLNMNGVVTGGTGSAQVTKDGADSLNGTFAYDSMSMNYDFVQQGQSVSAETKMDEMTGGYELAWKAGATNTDVSAVLDSLLKAQFNFKSNSISSKTSMGTPMGQVRVNVTAGSSSANYGLVDKVVQMESVTEKMSYDIQGGVIPPVNVTADIAGGGFEMPLENTDVAKPVKMKMDLQGLVLSDQLWAMFDPTAKLPRDKANLNVDISGDMKWTQKLSEINAGVPQMPVTFETAQINSFDISALGADVKTNGSLNIDSSQFPPVPTGTIKIDLNGASALLDSLSAAGLLPPQQAIAARGMMAVFFGAGDAPDSLTTDIEFTSDGRIKANGIPVK